MEFIKSKPMHVGIVAMALAVFAVAGAQWLSQSVPLRGQTAGSIPSHAWHSSECAQGVHLLESTLNFVLCSGTGESPVTSDDRFGELAWAYEYTLANVERTEDRFPGRWWFSDAHLAMVLQEEGPEVHAQYLNLLARNGEIDKFVHGRPYAIVASNSSFRCGNGLTGGNEPICGDSVVDPGEECDDGANNSDTEPDACRTDCTLPRCGDGVADSGEQCGEPGLVCPMDSLCIDCRCVPLMSQCGDGVLDPGEECDDGNQQNEDGCSEHCTIEVGWACNAFVQPSICEVIVPPFGEGDDNYAQCVAQGTGSQHPECAECLEHHCSGILEADMNSEDVWNNSCRNACYDVDQEYLACIAQGSGQSSACRSCLNAECDTVLLPDVSPATVWEACTECSRGLHACTEDNWTYTLSPATCPASGQQTRTWTRIGNCQGGVTKPASEVISCDDQDPTCTPDWECTHWSACRDSRQRRTCTDRNNCGVTTNKPALTQSCQLPGDLIVDMKANGSDGPINIAYGANVEITWSTQNATHCSNDEPFFQSLDFSGTEGQLTVRVPMYIHEEEGYFDGHTGFYTYPFSVTCYHENGMSKTDSVQVNIGSNPRPQPLPVVDIKANGSDGPIEVAWDVREIELTWSSENASSCQASGDWSDGSRSANGRRRFRYPITTARKEYSFSITCRNAEGTTATDTVVVNKLARVYEPVTVDIKANELDGPIDVPQDARVAISWTSQNATSCTALDDLATHFLYSPPFNSTKNISIRGTSSKRFYKFTITCTNPGGTTATDSVIVNLASPSVDIKINGSDGPISVVDGSTVDMTLSIENQPNTRPCQWSGGTLAGNLGSWRQRDFTINAKAHWQEPMVEKRHTHEFTLTCSTPWGGTATDTVIVNVVPKVDLKVSPDVKAFSWSPLGNKSDSILRAANQPFTLTWNAPYAGSCLASGGWSGAKPYVGDESMNGVTSDTTFTLTCETPGGVNSDSATVFVVTDPLVEIRANDEQSLLSIDNGSNVTLRWNISNAASCTTSGDWPSDWDFLNEMSGSNNYARGLGRIINATNSVLQKEYTITCTAPNGTTATDTVRINVSPHPVIRETDEKTDLRLARLRRDPVSSAVRITGSLHWHNPDIGDALCEASGRIIGPRGSVITQSSSDNDYWNIFRGWSRHWSLEPGVLPESSKPSSGFFDIDFTVAESRLADRPICAVKFGLRCLDKQETEVEIPFPKGKPTITGSVYWDQIPQPQNYVPIYANTFHYRLLYDFPYPIRFYLVDTVNPDRSISGIPSVGSREGLPAGAVVLDVSHVNIAGSNVIRLSNNLPDGRYAIKYDFKNPCTAEWEGDTITTFSPFRSRFPFPY